MKRQNRIYAFLDHEPELSNRMLPPKSTCQIRIGDTKITKPGPQISGQLLQHVCHEHYKCMAARSRPVPTWPSDSIHKSSTRLPKKALSFDKCPLKKGCLVVDDSMKKRVLERKKSVKERGIFWIKSTGAWQVA